MTPEEIEAQAARLEAEAGRLRARADELRALAAEQRALDRKLSAAGTALPTVRSEASMGSTLMRAEMTQEQRFKISASMARRFVGQRLWAALQARKLSVHEYARLAGKPFSTVASWMDPSKNGRRIGLEDAQYAEAFFGKDVLPAVDASYAHGISKRASRTRRAT